MIKQNYTLIGLMSGTSLDGVDLALCRFDEGKSDAVILKAQTFTYSTEWMEKLGNAQQNDAMAFWKLHVEYGHYLGQLVRKFCKGINEKVDAVASHGHTVFHQPHNGFTCQIGDGAAIAADCGITTICDFRSMDVAMGGQGAPLVPIGDKLLFGNYAACLNLGGIANISFDENCIRKAFDICPVNIVFNNLAQLLGKPYDEGGRMATEGKPDNELFEELNQLPFYSGEEKKSIGREWVEEEILGRFSKSGLAIQDKLATAVEHAAKQIAIVLNREKIKNVLVTGGGTYNDHLISSIKKLTSAELVIPDKKTIEFKEALIFAFLGMLRLKEEPNALKSVTGAQCDNVGGAIYYIKKTER
ncbi:MAG: anhydro-N-acetylmuramic acid kinase [Bacteroidia bacterium]